MFGKSLVLMAAYYGVRYAWHVHRRHEREALGNAIADAFQKRGMGL
jgi:hypothetical protein